jgi:hypothetical protein|tara:strand:+ start:619 stop:912 length:294 start_codon:yes stop_codon:yes gene_type:complete
MKTFKKDTVVCFHKTDFNLKGYGYYFIDNPNSVQPTLLVLDPKDLPRLKKELGDESFTNALDGTKDQILFSEEDFIFNETFNPFEKEDLHNAEHEGY